MRRVDIYLEASTRYLGEKERFCGYVMATELKNGELYTVHDFWPSAGTWNHITLESVNRALAHLAPGNEVHIHSANEYILDMIDNNLDGWKAQDFKTNKGTPVKNAGLWKEYSGRAQDHIVICEKGQHEYSSWMIGEMARKIVENPVDKAGRSPQNPHKQ